MKKNYQIELEKILNQVKDQEKAPRLLLHSCCAPCSSYVLEYLSNVFEITVFYYNPNIYPDDEYFKRLKEQKNFIKETGENKLVKDQHKIEFFEENYNQSDFYNIVRGLESKPEGGERCFKCFELRMEKAAEFAKKNNFDYFTTTLSISPHKNSQVLNQIGFQLEKKYGVKYLYSDFKKKNGFKRSIELSNIYKFYRQTYCGCIFSIAKNKEK